MRVNGGNVTDGRLSGAGVTAQNYGPVAPASQTGDFDVTFTASSAGELTGQQVHVANNFDNVDTQILQFAGAAYRYADPDVSPNPVNLGNHHVGDPAEQALTVANNAPADGYSEDLNANVGSETGHATSNGGSIVQLGPQQSDSTNLVVGINTATAGPKTGTVTVGLESDGANSSGLGTTSLPPEIVTVNGAVYRYADGNVGSPLHLGTFHQGDTAQGALTVSNDAVADGYSESLNAGFGGTGGDVNSAVGSINLLAAGGTDNTTMVVGIDTSAAGAKTGTANVDLTSDGAGTSGLGQTPLGQQQATVSADVYRLAVAQVNTASPVDLGIVHVGDTPTQPLSVTNDVAPDGYSESLNANMSGTTGDATGAGSFNLLPAGDTDNASLIVGVDASSAGIKNGIVTIDFESDGAGTSELGITPLSLQTVDVQAQVNNYAEALFSKLAGDGTFTGGGTLYTLDFGAFTEGGPAMAAELGLTNDVPAPADWLAGTWTLNAPDFTLTGFDPFDNLNAGDTLSGLGVELGSGTPGPFSGTITLDPRSRNAGGYDGPLDPITLNLEGVVTPAGSDLAVPDVSPNPMNLANVHVGDLAQGTLTVSNLADPGSEFLNASFGPTAGDVSSATGSVYQLPGGGTDSTSMVIGMDTSSAGAKTGTAQVDLESDDGAGGITPLDPETVTANVDVFRYADPGVAPGTVFSLDLTIHVGDALEVMIPVDNLAPNDGYSESLNATFENVTGGLVPISVVNLLPPGGSSNDLKMGVDSATAGDKSGTADIEYVSDGAGTSGPGQTLVETALLTMDIMVNNYADPEVIKTGGVGVLTKISEIEYALDFGTFFQSSGPREMEISVLNDCLAPGDWIDGSWVLDPGAFVCTGFDPFTDLGPGEMFEPIVRLGSDTLGAFTGSVTLSCVGKNDSYNGAFDDIAITLHGEVIESGEEPIPEPAALSLFGGAALIALARRRRRA